MIHKYLLNQETKKYHPVTDDGYLWYDEECGLDRVPKGATQMPRWFNYDTDLSLLQGIVGIATLRDGKKAFYTKKEVIFATGDDTNHIHGEVYETYFESDYYTSIIGTKYRWRGKVKITIEQM